MAAHVVTALREIKGMAERGKEVYGLEGALSLSCWTEDLDLDDYRSLGHLIGNPAAMLAWVRVAIEKYTQVWEQLGQPATREEWRPAYHKAWRDIRVNVTWDCVWGQGVKSLGLATIACTCKECKGGTNGN